jgi:hypothetical protein
LNLSVANQTYSSLLYFDDKIKLVDLIESEPNRMNKLPVEHYPNMVPKLEQSLKKELTKYEDLFEYPQNPALTQVTKSKTIIT